MASFDGACMLTGVPIHYDDPVRIIILRRSPYRGQDWWQPGGGTGSEHFAEPVGLPLTGCYDDYGHAHRVADDWAWAVTGGYLRALPDGGVLEPDGVCSWTWGAAGGAYGFALIHADAYATCAAAAGAERESRAGGTSRSTWLISQLQLWLAAAARKRQEIAERRLRYAQLGGRETQTEAEELDQALFSISPTLAGLHWSNPWPAILRANVEWLGMDQALRDLLQDGAASKAAELVEWACFKYYMGFTHTPWLPPIQGGQQDHVGLHAARAKATQAAVARLKRRP